MGVRDWNLAGYAMFLALTIHFTASMAAISTNRYPKAISDLKEVIVRGLGLQSDDVNISGFDLRDALVGRSIVYEIHLEMDDKILPLKLLDNINEWQHEDLPILLQNNILLSKANNNSDKPSVLPPFQLAGPVELWIQDASNLKLSLPHHIDGAAVRKVIIADEAVVTVKGAKSVTLLTPIKVELPLTKPQDGFASRMLNLAHHLRHAARSQGQPLSLSIVGPTSLSSPTPSPSVNQPELHLLVNGSNTFWPINSLNGSNTHLIGFDKLLSSIFGPKTNEDGSFKLLKADVSAQTFVKIGFQVERSLGNGPELAGYPKWRTKPTMARKHFEVLAKVDGDKFVPEQVIQVEPVKLKDTIAPNVITGNVTSSKVFTMTPPKPFTL